jgi:hypothetical protein
MQKARAMKGDNRAQGNIGGLFIGIMISVILGVSVAIPVIQNAVTNSSVSGNTETVLNLLPLFIGLLLLLALAGPLMRRVQ